MNLEDQEMVVEFEDFIAWLKKSKPNDRSDRDRYWAIVITELEKAFAVFKTFALKQNQ